MNIKVFFVSIFVVAMIIGSGCLNIKEEIRSGQVQVKEFKWLNFNFIGVGFQMILSSNYDGDAIVEVYLGDEKIAWKTINTGENLIQSDYSDIVTYSNEVLNQRLKSKWQEQLTIKNEKGDIIYSSIIDMPYINYDIKPSNTVIGNDGGYLKVTNNGNIEGNIKIEKDMWSCGVGFSKNAWNGWITDTILKPQESKQIPVEVIKENRDCNLETGDSGITEFKVTFPLWDKTINLDEIDVRYRNT